MDKVKDIFHLVFVKHQFWTLSIIVVLTGLGIWWMATGNLKKEYKDNHSKVETASTNAVTVAGKAENTIFNDTSHQGMKDLNTLRRRQVYEAWNKMYQRQRTDVLVWPEGLSQKFVTRIEDLLQGRPIEEVKPKADGSEHLVLQLREEYRNEIKDLLPKLAEMINAKWDPQGGARRGPRGGAGGAFGEFGGGIGRGGLEGGGAQAGGEDDEPEKEYAVWWDPSDQGGIQSTYFDWSDSETPPSTMEILYSMEDYWVLKALMQIIQRTNASDDDAKTPPSRPELAAIREVHEIHIGTAVESNVGQVRVVASKKGRGEAGEEDPSVSATENPRPQPAGEGTLEGGANGTTPAGPDPVEGRYVDKNYLPLKAETIRTAAESTKTEAYLAVAKRMPVRMLVKMDQRKLNKFLVECGNADLMLEVKQVRINPKLPDIVSSTTARGGGAAGAFGGEQNLGNNRGRGGDVSQDNEGKFPWDVMVEVYGIIYIFNPPSTKRLTDKLEAEDIAKFEAWVKEQASAKTGDDAESSDKTGEETDPSESADETADADAAEETAGEVAADVDEPADEPADTGEADDGAADDEPADESKDEPAKPAENEAEPLEAAAG
jgi:hypothetical protein